MLDSFLFSVNVLKTHTWSHGNKIFTRHMTSHLLLVIELSHTRRAMMTVWQCTAIRTGVAHAAKDESNWIKLITHPINSCIDRKHRIISQACRFGFLGMCWFHPGTLSACQWTVAHLLLRNTSHSCNDNTIIPHTANREQLFLLYVRSLVTY